MDAVLNRNMTVGGAILAIIGIFLPTVTLSFGAFSKSMKYISGDGKILLAILVLIALLSLKDAISSKISAIILYLLGAAMFTYDMININKIMSSNEINNMSEFDSGFYAMLIGLILIGSSIAVSRKKVD